MLTNALDALAHGGDFLHPQASELYIRQHHSGQGAAVARRIGIDYAHQALDVRKTRGRGRGAFGHEQQRADALAIEPHVLGERRRNQGFGHLLQHRQQAGAVLLDARTESLISKVEERQPARLGGHIRDPCPTRGIQIGAGRIMAADVQQDDIASGNFFQRRTHRVDVHPLQGGIIVGIGFRRKTRRGKNTMVVAPGRVGPPQSCPRAKGFKQFRAHAQGAGTARGLGHGHAT